MLRDNQVGCVICAPENYLHKNAHKIVRDKGNCMFITWFTMITASGQSSDPVFLIADSSMGDEIIDVHKISGQGFTTHVDTSYFAKQDVAITLVE